MGLATTLLAQIRQLNYIALLRSGNAKIYAQTSNPCKLTLLGYTSRKHGKKEPQSFVHCGSFNHPNLQLLNDRRCFFFVLRL
jgi:hypothetical protein